MKPNQLKDLVPGDWINFEFGFNRNDWYVVENVPDKKMIRLGLPIWLVSSARWFDYKTLENASAHGEWFFRGNSKLRWWRPLTLIFMDCVPPYPSPQPERVE